MSSARAGGVVLGLVAPFLLQATAWASPFPEPGVDPLTAAADATQARRMDRLERAVRARERALAHIYQAADAHAEEIGEEMARLAALGYTGDLADLTHVLPLPVSSYHLSAGYGETGPLWESIHTGLDIVAPLGTTLTAIGDGTITSVADAGPYGLRTVLTLADGTELWYCHQEAAVVETGATVEVGQPIGVLGSTGNSTGPHLHLEIRPDGGAPVDPMAWFHAVGLQP